MMELSFLGYIRETAGADGGSIAEPADVGVEDIKTEQQTDEGNKNNGEYEKGILFLFHILDAGLRSSIRWI